MIGGRQVAKLSNKNLLFIAVILSLLTAVLVYNYLKGMTGQGGGPEGISVIVAKVDIPPKTKITLEMVTEVKVPAEYIQPGAVTALDKVVGILVREQIMSGEQVVERRLVRESKSVGFTGMIPRDKRAVTVAVNEVTGVAGFVKAGDYIDVVVSFDATMAGDYVSQVVMQNILVLAANRDTEVNTGNAPGKESGKEVNKIGTVTMAVTPDEAAKLTLADEKGKIRLTLRPYLPLDAIMLTEAVTPKDLVGMHSSPLKNEQAPPIQPPIQSTMQPPGVQGNQPSITQGQPTFGIKVIRGTKTQGEPAAGK